MSLVKYVLTACIRDKVFLSVIIAMAVAVSLSVFMGSTAVIEQDQFVIVFSASSLRFLVVAGMTLFIVFYTRRSIEQRDLDYLITRPLTRANYIISHILAFSIVSFILTMTITLAVSILGKNYFNQGYILWGYSMFFELAIISTVAFFFSMVLRSAVSSVLATFALYSLSRMIGQIIGIATTPDISTNYSFFSRAMETLSLFVPRLDLFSQSSWLLYGVDDAFFYAVLIAVQGIVFISILAIMALIDLTKKEF